MHKTARLLLAASFSSYLGEALLGPIYAIFVKNIGGDVLTVGATYGVFAVMSGIFIFVIGRSKIFKRYIREMVVLGFGMLVLGGVGYLFVQNSTQLFLLQIFMALGEGIIEPSWNGLFSANLSEQESTHFWATFGGGQKIILGVGALLGGALVQFFSFKVLFIALVCLQVLATVFATQILWIKKQS